MKFFQASFTHANGAASREALKRKKQPEIQNEARAPSPKRPTALAASQPEGKLGELALGLTRQELVFYFNIDTARLLTPLSPLLRRITPTGPTSDESKSRWKGNAKVFPVLTSTPTIPFPMKETTEATTADVCQNFEIHLAALVLKYPFLKMPC